MYRLACWLALIVSAGVCAGACLGNTNVKSPAARQARRYKITIEAASILASREGGRPWHVRKPSGWLPALGGLVGLGLGHPAIGAAVGKALAGGEDRYPPNPYVELKVGATTYSTLPAGPTLDPKWAYPIAIDLSEASPNDEVVVLVRDAFDKGVIGSAKMSVQRLLSQPFHRLHSAGRVAALELRVAELRPANQHRTVSFVVPGNRSAKELVRGGASPGYERVPLLNGEIVRVTATGRVCPSNSKSDCVGPGGAESGRWESYNYEVFRKAPHASLVGVYADVPVLVGASKSFVAQRSGELFLFVNDTDLDNNSGSFKVRVIIEPPK